VRRSFRCSICSGIVRAFKNSAKTTRRRRISKATPNVSGLVAQNIPGVYVARNASRGVQLVIAAAAEGMQAAFAINSALLDADAASNALRDHEPGRTCAIESHYGKAATRPLTKCTCERLPCVGTRCVSRRVLKFRDRRFWSPFTSEKAFRARSNDLIEIEPHGWGGSIFSDHRRRAVSSEKNQAFNYAPPGQRSTRPTLKIARGL
jgi:hypothetical protein